MQIKTGDTVVVIAGKDKYTKDAKGNIVPTTGKVLKAYPKTNRVIVEGVNMVTKHIKPSQLDPEGGIVTREAPIHASNVAYYDSKAKKPVKVGYQGEGKEKVRINKETGAVLDKNSKSHFGL